MAFSEGEARNLQEDREGRPGRAEGTWRLTGSYVGKMSFGPNMESWEKEVKQWEDSLPKKADEK